jgi:cupin 2 domain-containing protein
MVRLPVLLNCGRIAQAKTFDNYLLKLGNISLAIWGAKLMAADPEAGNLYAGLPVRLAEERTDVLARTRGARVERIVSTGQATPPGEWYDQDDDEWVVLLTGAAGLLLEGEEAARTLERGDWVLIPAHVRHRVEWTAAGEPTVWLAVHMAPGQGGA